MVNNNCNYFFYDFHAYNHVNNNNNNNNSMEHNVEKEEEKNNPESTTFSIDDQPFVFPHEVKLKNLLMVAKKYYWPDRVYSMLLLHLESILNYQLTYSLEELISSIPEEYKKLFYDRWMESTKIDDKDLPIVIKGLKKLALSKQKDRGDYTKTQQKYAEKYSEMLQNIAATDKKEIEESFLARDEFIGKRDIWTWNLEKFISKIEKDQPADFIEFLKQKKSLMNQYEDVFFILEGMSQEWKDLFCCLWHQYAKLDSSIRKKADYDDRRHKAPLSKEKDESIHIINPNAPIFFTTSAIDYVVEKQLKDYIELYVLCGANPFENLDEKKVHCFQHPIQKPALSSLIAKCLKPTVVSEVFLPRSPEFKDIFNYKLVFKKGYDISDADKLMAWFAKGLLIDQLISIQQDYIAQSFVNSSSTLNVLPKEIWKIIFSNLTHHNVLSLTRNLGKKGVLKQRKVAEDRIFESIDASRFNTQTISNLHEAIKSILRITHGFWCEVNNELVGDLEKEVASLETENVEDFIDMSRSLDSAYKSRSWYPFKISIRE